MFRRGGGAKSGHDGARRATEQAPRVELAERAGSAAESAAEAPTPGSGAAGSPSRSMASRVASRVKGWPHGHVEPAETKGSPDGTAGELSAESPPPVPGPSAHFVSHGELVPEEMLKEMGPDEALRLLQSDREKGLTSAEVQRRLELFGPNEVPEKKRNKFLVFLSFMWNPLSWVMEAAAIVAIAVANGGGEPPDWEDFLGIVVLLLINATIGFFEENSASNAVAALKARLAPTARALRDGEVQEVQSASLVPGDVIYLKLGDCVPADAKIIGGEPLKVDQSALTGESLPATAGPGDDVFSGSTIKTGEAEAAVTATGPNTFFGRAAGLVDTAETSSHFQQLLTAIGGFCIVYILVFLIVLVVTMYAAMNYPYRTGVSNGLVLLIGGVPIAMPTVLSVTLAIGASHLARKKAIVTRITAIEELSGLNMLCSDKTGTLTLNRLTVNTALMQQMGLCYGHTVTPAASLLYAARAARVSNPDAIDRAIVEALGELPEEDYDATGAPEVHLDSSSGESDVAAPALQSSARLGGGTGASTNLGEGSVDGTAAEGAGGDEGDEDDGTPDDAPEGTKSASAASLKLGQRRARAGIQELHFMPFDPVGKRTQSTFLETRTGRAYRVTKGAPQIILDLCLPLPHDEQALELSKLLGMDASQLDVLRGTVNGDIDALATRGYRALGVAICNVPALDVEVPSSEDNSDANEFRSIASPLEASVAPGEQWELLAMLPVFDPPRHDTAETIKRAQDLGVEVKMITGDQLAIGKETARQLDMGTRFVDSPDLFAPGPHPDLTPDGLQRDAVIREANGFAGVFPEHKYAIVQTLKKLGFTVGMTGDGVNDAPALKVAHVGVAVADATDAARGASDIVLTEKGLSVIIDAIIESRCIFQRMKSYVLYACATTVGIVTRFSVLVWAFRFNMPPFMILILAYLNDGTIMTVSTDRVSPSRTPDVWRLWKLFIEGIVIGLYLAASTVVFVVVARETNFFVDHFNLRDAEEIRFGDSTQNDSGVNSFVFHNVVYLQVSILGQAVIFVSRSQGFFFMQRPSILLALAFVIAQLVATFIGVYANWGFTKVRGAGWNWAGVAWVWDIIWFLPLDLVKLSVRLMMSPSTWGHFNYKSVAQPLFHKPHKEAEERRRPTSARPMGLATSIEVLTMHPSG